MPDLVGTCPKDFWESWIREGDAVGEAETGEDWYWYTRDPKAASIKPGERFCIVAHGKLRGWAPVVRVDKFADGSWGIVRRGGAVACTIPQPIPGFRGLRVRWWNRDDEQPFENWKSR